MKPLHRTQTPRLNCRTFLTTSIMRRIPSRAIAGLTLTLLLAACQDATYWKHDFEYWQAQHFEPITPTPQDEAIADRWVAQRLDALIEPAHNGISVYSTTVAGSPAGRVFVPVGSRFSLYCDSWPWFMTGTPLTQVMLDQPTDGNRDAAKPPTLSFSPMSLAMPKLSKRMCAQTSARLTTLGMEDWTGRDPPQILKDVEPPGLIEPLFGR